MYTLSPPETKYNTAILTATPFVNDLKLWHDRSRLRRLPFQRRGLLGRGA